MDSKDLSWLLDVAQAGSLSAAAKGHGVAVSTVARRLDALEGTLKLRLLDRRRDGVRLTRDGERIATIAASVVDGIGRLELAAAAMRGGGKEPVIVSATEFIVSDVLAPALPRLWARHPALKVDLRAQAQVVSLAGREADLAVRMSRPEGASLLAKKLPTQKLGLFASRDYLAGRDPATLDLSCERLIVYDDSYGRLSELDWLSLCDLNRAVFARTGSTRGLLSAAVAGAGIALLPVVFAKQAALVEVSAPVPLLSRNPWLVVHRDVRRLPAIATVHAWVIDTFKQIGGQSSIGKDNRFDRRQRLSQ